MMPASYRIFYFHFQLLSFLFAESFRGQYRYLLLFVNFASRDSLMRRQRLRYISYFYEYILFDFLASFRR